MNTEKEMIKATLVAELSCIGAESSLAKQKRGKMIQQELFHEGHCSKEELDDLMKRIKKLQAQGDHMYAELMQPVSTAVHMKKLKHRINMTTQELIKIKFTKWDTGGRDYYNDLLNIMRELVELEQELKFTTQTIHERILD